MQGMMSLLAGLALGSNDYRKEQLDRERQAKLDQILLDRNAREQTAFTQEQADQQSIRSAAAPVVATPDMLPVPAGAAPQARMLPDPSSDNIDAGQPGTAAPVPSMSVAGRSGLTPGQATSAATAANTPQATNQRVVAAMQAINPKAAAQMQDAALGIEQKQLDLANHRWNDDVATARTKGLPGLLAFADETHADGQGGAVKSKAVVSPDGKTFQVVQVMPDGTTQPTKMPPLPNTEEGYDILANSMQKVPIDRRLAHWEQVRKDSITERRAEAEEKYHGRMASVAEENVRNQGRNVDSEIAYRKTMGDAATTKAENGPAPRKSLEERMPEGERIAYNAAIKRREKVADTIDKAKADGSWDPDKNAGHKSLQSDYDAASMKASLLEKRYAGNDIAGSDPYGARNAGGKDGENLRRAQDAAKRQPDQRAAILSEELAKATDPEDRASIQREIDRLPASARTPRMQPTAARAAVAPPPSVAGAPVAPAAPAAAPAAPAIRPQDIPPAPPEAVQQRVRTPIGMVDKMVPNPAFVAWRAQYGAAFDALQEQQRAAATDAARAAYRPEAAPYSMRRLSGS
jgi:hypothetical protein